MYLYLARDSKFKSLAHSSHSARVSTKLVHHLSPVKPSICNFNDTEASPAEITLMLHSFHFYITSYADTYQICKKGVWKLSRGKNNEWYTTSKSKAVNIGAFS